MSLDRHVPAWPTEEGKYGDKGEFNGSLEVGEPILKLPP